MYLPSKWTIGFLVAILLGVGGWSAPAQSAAPAASPATGVLRGHVTDPTGALIPGAQITVTTAQGTPVSTTTADAAGGYVVRGLAPGSYVVQAQFAGFAPLVSPPISIANGQAKTFDIKLEVESASQQVEVEAEGSPTVSTDASANASAVVLKGDALDALSDDPDELSNELSALAGPSAGPNGGQIYIDGFTGGQLPPKSAIREIRINQNPFSAEFDRLGYGRIEILTKPGTDTLHGRVFGLGNDNAFNTGNPFAKQIPAYDSIQYNGTVSGPISKNASFFISVEGRNTQDASIYTAYTALQNPTTGAWYAPTSPVTGGLFAPQTRISVSPRIDLQLGQKNTLTTRFQFWHNTSTGQIGNTALPTQNTSSQSNEYNLQLDDTQIVSDRLVQEVRFQYRHAPSTELASPDAAALIPAPLSTAPTITIPSYFTGGASTIQSVNSHSDHFELQEFITMTAGTQAIKFGTWLRDNHQATTSTSNFNGTFSFPSLAAYVDTLNGLANGQTVAQIAAACPQAGTCTPNKLTYTTGPSGYQGNLFDGALYFQDDWKYSRFLTLSGGLRWETQNHVADHSDFAPRVAFAYALDGHKNQRQAKTVLRGGFGFFYDRFSVGNLMNIEQNNGTAKSQTQTVITNPTCFSATSLQSALSQGCTTGGAVAATTAQYNAVSSAYRSPYAEQAGVSVERQLTKTSTLTFTYLRSFGVHELVTRDANPYTPLPGTIFYNSTTGPRLLAAQGNDSIVDQYFPEAVYKQNQLTVNINAQFSRKFSVNGFYNWTDANSDGGGGSNASNSYDLSADYGRAAFVRPQQVFLMSTYSGPWRMTFNPFVVFQAGRPYSVTTANDLTGDNFFNDRPAYATSASSPANVVQTSFGPLDTDPSSPSEAVMPPDLLFGPNAVAVNMRVSRSFGIGPSVESAGGPQRGGGRPGGPGGFNAGPGPGGRGGRGGGGFGGPGGGFGGMSGTGHKYSLTFSAQALNLFNNIDYGTPSGTIVPTPNASTGLNGPGSRFGESTSLAGGMFASPSGSAARRIFLQAFFTF